ncbi:hypothetical protein AGOR_G00252400 [Albula goreensis]|uniref:Uncharacterized protein n=1 Tax=Albula goreensis TaxID=1534307 RepID=A0A8T3CAB7_9TELE|nr:hypothetical protein AGOR_G00252400 [Albula goreensis]
MRCTCEEVSLREQERKEVDGVDLSASLDVEQMDTGGTGTSQQSDAGGLPFSERGEDCSSRENRGSEHLVVEAFQACQAARCPDCHRAFMRCTCEEVSLREQERKEVDGVDLSASLDVEQMDTGGTGTSQQSDAGGLPFLREEKTVLAGKIGDRNISLSR